MDRIHLVCSLYSIFKDICHIIFGNLLRISHQEVVLAQVEMKGSKRRTQMGRKREVKDGIKRLEKMMKTVVFWYIAEIYVFLL